MFAHPGHSPGQALSAGLGGRGVRGIGNAAPGPSVLQPGAQTYRVGSGHPREPLKKEGGRARLVSQKHGPAGGLEPGSPREGWGRKGQARGGAVQGRVLGARLGEAQETVLTPHKAPCSPGRGSAGGLLTVTCGDQMWGPTPEGPQRHLNSRPFASDFLSPTSGDTRVPEGPREAEVPSVPV